MRLPDDFPFVILPRLPNDDRPFVKMTEEFIETLVRDCAKVAGEPNGFAGTEYALGREDAESAILRRYGLGEREMSTNDHTHTADYDAHGCAYKEPTAEPPAAPDAQTPSKTPRDNEYVDPAFVRDLKNENADLRRQLAEAETAHGVTLRRCAASERELAAERAAREAEREKDGDYMRESINRYKEQAEQAERERDAALAQAAAVQEAAIRFFDQEQYPMVRKPLQAALRRHLATIAPEAGRNVVEDAARFQSLPKWMSAICWNTASNLPPLGHLKHGFSLDDLRAWLDDANAARKGEEG